MIVLISGEARSVKMWQRPPLRMGAGAYSLDASWESVDGESQAILAELQAISGESTVNSGWPR